MLKLTEIIFDCTEVKIPLGIALTDWNEVVTYVKTYLFEHRGYTYKLEALPFNADENVSGYLIKADSPYQLDLDMYDSFNNAETLYHENVVFEPTYLSEVYIDEALIESSNNWQNEGNLDLAIFEVLQSHFIVDGDLLDV